MKSKMVDTYLITLKNYSGLTFEVGQDQPLLHSLEYNGVSLPFGCRYGGCISCAAKLLSGNVDCHEGSALNQRQLDEGYILLCVAKPKSNCVINVGVESHDTLYQNPFMKPVKGWPLKNEPVIKSEVGS